MKLQNKDALFPKDSDGRSFSKDWFYMNLDYVETMLRTGLVFSPVKLCCILLSLHAFSEGQREKFFWKAKRI